MSDDFPSLYTPSASASAEAGPSTFTGGPTSARALEQMHEQAEATTSSAQGGPSRSQLDLGSESAFPSLGAPSKVGAAGSASRWGVAAARSKAAAPSIPQPSAPLYTETLVLPSSSINVSPAPSSGSNSRNSPAGSDATTLGGVINHLMTRYPHVKIEASSSTFKQTTTFLFKALRQQDVERVKVELKTRIVRKVSETIQVPASTRAFIIGSKGIAYSIMKGSPVLKPRTPSGRTLKSITDETGVNIQIPRDNGAPAEASDSNEPAYENDEPEDPLISIALFGDGGSVAQAKQRILAIVSERTSRLSTKLTTIPTDLYHLLSAKVARNEIISESDSENVTIHIPPVWDFRSGASRGASANASEDLFDKKEERDTSISISGDREMVARVTEALVAAADELGRTTQNLHVTLPKRQHRFILPPISDQILHATSCSVEVPPSSDSSDQVTIRGPSSQLVEALQMVMQKANAASVDVVDLATVHGINTPSTYAKQCARYLLNKAKLRKIADEESVQIFIPRSNDPHTTIDIVATQGPRGPAAAVSAARNKVLEILKTIPPEAFGTVEIDQLLHRFLIGRKSSRIHIFEEKHRVEVIFPPTGAVDDKQITLVYIGTKYTEASEQVSEVKDEMVKLAKEAADISTSTLSIPAKLHRFIIGPSGTTLNALIGIGDERIVNVKFGSSAAASKGIAQNGDTAKNEDEIIIRGPGDEVNRISKEIERIAEEAKNDEIVNSYTMEFDIEQRFVSHIVGKGGSGVQKLRDELGVRVEFGDGITPAAPSSDNTSKGKKSSASKVSAMSHVKIQGRKENVEEAKKKVLRQTESLADETTLNVPILAGLDRGSLIGKQGSYLQRLETKYEVRINFPRANAAEEGQADDAITIRGGKKGVESAKKELVELMEYEKEHGHSTTLTIPARALPRIFGRQGATIRELQEESKAEIDVVKSNQSNNPDASSTLTIKGTKQAVAAAKKAVSAIVADIQDESTFEITIERPLHVTIIGKGGQNIRDLIARCGGPSDAKAAGGLVRFPRAAEEPSDTVVIRGPSALATKIKAELEKQASSLRDRIVYGVIVPQSGHARLIGRGGAGVNELQRKHDVKIVLPNRKEARSSGDIINKDDLGEYAESDLIKLMGSKLACDAAAAELTHNAAAAASSGGNGPRQQQQRQQSQPSDQLVKTVMVPSRRHARITQGGKFFRSLPSGIRIDHGDAKPPTHATHSKTNGTSTTTTKAASSARIDESTSEDHQEFNWDITSLLEDGENPEEGLEEISSSSNTMIPWNIRGNDQVKVDRVEASIQAALAKTLTETHQGILTVPQSLMPRIVGRGGSGLDKLRSLGVSAEVEGRQGANSVIFLGTPETLEKARQAVMELSQSQRYNGQ